MKDINIKQNKESVSSLNVAEKDYNDSLNPSLLAKQVLIKGENKKEFVDFVVKMLKETRISTEIEKEFVKKYIFSMWKLKRARVMEKNLLNSQQQFSKEETYWASKKMRIRNLKRIHLSEELQKVIYYQDRLEKQGLKALKQIKQFEKIL